MKELPLYPGAKPCVRSGYCCKKVPCAFGRWNSDRSQCEHLAKDESGRYCCGIFEFIIQQPGWELTPAFGAGCCSPMNSDRIEILKRKQSI